MCGWCRGSIDVTARADSVYCGQSCRQAAFRTRIRRAELEATGRPLRLAYADPPYPGMSGLYRGHPDYAGEVDHGELLSRLQTYDGWALSTSAEALPEILTLAVAQVLAVRVAVWVRSPIPHPVAATVSSWEAVVYSSCRRLRDPDATRATPDALVGVDGRRRKTLPGWVIGAKPPTFCRWVFELIGARVGDSLDDLYPGSGIVGRSWEWYSGRDPSREYSADAEGDSGS